ncbi:peptidylprolyl isomerase [Polynucleobacter kasalickyi]|uniref:Chaperone SurA n=1 Tax=Polynucleobacter kasalickyi TaxID=1938817 RepID=A0A1W1YPT2_9BURK|nr:peptidylprolyl isomerase [Polynucleobacter kasalickyi]SMC37738.1 periplasmic chaperone for outer membrane proteins SurA [Polynucleobacter kasalickyi]
MTRMPKKCLLNALLSVLMIGAFYSVAVFAAEVTKPASKPSAKNVKPVPPPEAPEAPPERTSSMNLSIDKNEIDRVLATVNREVITLKDLKDRIELVKKQINEAKRPLPPEDVLIQTVFDKLIEESVIYQEATYANFKISDLEYDAILNNVFNQRKMTAAEFQQSLESNGQSFQKFKETLRRDILITRFRERLVESRVKVTDSEVNDYIASRLNNNQSSTPAPTASPNVPETLYISQILVPTKDTDSRSEINAAKVKADDIFQQVKNEKEYINFVNRLVQVDKTVKVQDLGYRTLDRLPQLFIDATAKLQAGDLVPSVLRTSAGFHIVKLLDRKGGKVGAQASTGPEITLGQSIQVEQFEVRHLMLAKKPGVSDTDLERKIKAYKVQVESKNADFGDLAKKFSDDKDTGANSGYIGWISAGQTMPEFDFALKNTKPNSVTEPFQTSYGWHILQVMNKQSKEITFSQQKEYAKNTLRQERLDQTYQDWVRELRDNATIELRPPFAPEK